MSDDSYYTCENGFELTALEVGERLAEMKRILTEELPADNYFVLKYIVHFLTEVHSFFLFAYCLHYLCGVS